MVLLPFDSQHSWKRGLTLLLTALTALLPSISRLALQLVHINSAEVLICLSLYSQPSNLASARFAKPSHHMLMDVTGAYTFYDNPPNRYTKVGLCLLLLGKVEGI